MSIKHRKLALAVLAAGAMAGIAITVHELREDGDVEALPAAAGTAGMSGKVGLNFDGDQPGGVPGEIEVVTGKWAAQADATAPSQPNALGQVGKGEGAPFNVCVVKDARFQNVALAVQLRALDGRDDQGGGLVWRYQSPGNYYVCRYNPLEGNYNVYRCTKGWRRTLQAKRVRPAPGWHTLRAEMVGDRIQCYFDSRLVLDVKDDTFAGAGQVRLWSKADAHTNFDDFTAEAASPGSR